jgi:hypothetical protein
MDDDGCHVELYFYDTSQQSPPSSCQLLQALGKSFQALDQLLHALDQLLHALGQWFQELILNLHDSITIVFIPRI